ncbi:MAG: dienelactone hydrolase family protein, partial [Gammaproteobacteria bacterium]|nr:dienelactone hydrolase family protein [Gammaproteobacteria bacterium]
VYYGGQIIPYVEERENCPLLMHFGRRDQGIPLADVHRITTSHADAVVHLYDADHGFNCNYRSSYDKPSATLAYERTLAFFADYLGTP